MKEERFYLVFDSNEQGILLRSLCDEKNAQLDKGKSTDGIDELIVKVGKAPTRSMKVITRDDTAR
jgi:hypothetical protein